MNPDSNHLNELDKLILEALKERPGRELPRTFTDTLIRKIERKLTWRQLIREFAVKTGIAAGIIMVLVVCLFLPVRETTNPFLLMVMKNWQLVSGILFLILFTFFSDQVLLKFYTKRRVTDAS